MLVKILYLLCLILFIPELAMAARILCLFSMPFASHQSVFQKLIEVLANDGHHLVVLTPLPHETPIPNVTEIDVHDLSYEIWGQMAGETLKHRNTFKMDQEMLVSEVLFKTHYVMFDAQLRVPEMQRIIQDESQEFDLLLLEPCARATLIISARFKAPVIMVSSFYVFRNEYYDVGAALDPIFFPDVTIKRSSKSSLWNKLSALYLNMKFKYIDWQVEKAENEMIRKHFGDQAPTIAELRKNVHMLLLNVHHLWDYNRPVSPNVLYLGGLHLKEPKPLHQSLKDYLDKSVNGVVYMSLGSKILSSDLPVPTIRIILKVFASLPYNVIWKWNGPDIPNLPKNIRLETWLPQNDMLHHSNIKVFLTHAGLQSTDEAIAARVPVIGLPVFSDQFSNAEKYEEYGIGVEMDIDNLDEDYFRKTIIEVAQNIKYRENIDKLARIMEVQRTGTLENALRWINHTALYGAQQLRSPLIDLSFVEYYLLDVIAAVVVIALIIVASVIILFKYFLTKLSSLFISTNKIKIN